MGARRESEEEGVEKGELGNDGARMVVDGDERSVVASPEVQGQEDGERRLARPFAGEGERQISGLESAADGEGAPMYMSYPPEERENVRRRDAYGN